MVVRDTKTGAYVGIRCSHEGCSTMAPSQDDILRGHGLMNMGWLCSGGTHYCPEHAPEHK